MTKFSQLTVSLLTYTMYVFMVSKKEDFGLYLKVRDGRMNQKWNDEGSGTKREANEDGEVGPAIHKIF